MDGTVNHRRSPVRSPLLAAALAFVAAALIAASASAQEILTDPAEGAKVSWSIDPMNSEATILAHRRQSRWFHGGKDAEELQLRFKDVSRNVAVYRAVPASQLLEELKASLWVRCRIKGLRLALGVTFPHQIDPETQKPLFAPLYGPLSEGGDRFQNLTVSVDREALSRMQTLLRAKLAQRVDTRKIDFRDAYVDQVVLLVPTAIGPGEIQWDDLSYGPIVAPINVEKAAGSEIDRAARLSWSDNRLLSNGQPILPRFITYQGEPATLLRELQVNAVWIEKYDEQSVLEALSGEGLGIFATPPPPPETDGRDKVSLPPFGTESNLIDCWMLGRLDIRKLEYVERWAELVQDADRQHRLLLGDVAGHVREFHRCVPLLGASRHIPHTSVTPAEYCEFLELRRQQALAGHPMATLLPTETSEAIRTSRRSTDREPVMEPEQIALCTHLAAASGYKLFGFWTHTALDSEAAGMEERRQMLKLLNIELRLLEPWLATGTITNTAEVRLREAAVAPNSNSKSNKKLSFNPFALRSSTPAEEAGPKPPYRATILRSAGSLGTLVLVDCVEDGAQFQPGPMTQQNLRFMTTRYDDVPTAYEVTTTSVNSIEINLQPVAGGMEIELKDFDQHAAIIMTSDPSRIEDLKREVKAIAPAAGAAAVALATAKLERVEKTHQELQPLSPPVPTATGLLNEARRYLRAADDDLHGGRFDEARRKSQKVMSLTRSVQRAYWELAVHRLSSPVASPHAICFQTLPDHWKMMRRLSPAKSPGENILRSGDFEDIDAVRNQWRSKSDVPGTEAVSLNPRSAQGKYSLALTALPNVERPPAVEEALITLYSPQMTAYTGQLVRVTGKVLLPRDLQGGVDGLVVYDTLKGTVGAHRFRKASPPGKWQSFEMYRDVLSTGEFQLVFELRGWGEAWIDNLEVTVVDAESDVQTAGGTK